MKQNNRKKPSVFSTEGVSGLEHGARVQLLEPGDEFTCRFQLVPEDVRCCVRLDLMSIGREDETVRLTLNVQYVSNMGPGIPFTIVSFWRLRREEDESGCRFNHDRDFPFYAGDAFGDEDSFLDRAVVLAARKLQQLVRPERGWNLGAILENDPWLLHDVKARENRHGSLCDAIFFLRIVGAHTLHHPPRIRFSGSAKDKRHKPKSSLQWYITKNVNSTRQYEK